MENLDRFGYPDWLDAEATRLARIESYPDLQAEAQSALRRAVSSGRAMVPNESIRDQFALAALSGICASVDKKPGETAADARDRVAEACYRMADAMLAERTK